MLENRNISVNMGTEALVAGYGKSRNTCIHIKISPCLGLLTMDQTYKNNLTYICIHLFLTLNTNKDIIVKYQKRRKHCRNQDHTTQHQCTEKVFVHSLNYWRGRSFEGDR
jgi:hypothetical protein